MLGTTRRAWEDPKKAAKPFDHLALPIRHDKIAWFHAVVRNAAGLDEDQSHLSARRALALPEVDNHQTSARPSPDWLPGLALVVSLTAFALDFMPLPLFPR